MCRIHLRREQRGQLLSSRARRSGFSPSEWLPPPLPGRAGRLLHYPCLPGGLASLFLVSKQAKQEKKKKINKQHMISSRKSSAASRVRGRSLLRRLKRPRLCPSCRRVLWGPETLGLMGCCPETLAALGAQCPPAAFLLCFPSCHVRFAGVPSCQELALGCGNLGFHLQCHETGFER